MPTAFGKFQLAETAAFSAESTNGLTLLSAVGKSPEFTALTPVYRFPI
jgi:hypothetical protein